MSTHELRETSRYRWLIMLLCMLTAMFVITMPTISLSVLFKEIAADLQLDLVQIGVIWGIASFMGMAVGMLGGAISDKIGTRRSLLTICVSAGFFGALRGISTDFYTFVLFSFFLGLFQQAMPPVLVKTVGHWFPRSQLGTANGILSAGFGGGLMLGSLISATILSPLLGGWRAVMFFYGSLGFVMAGFWFFLHPAEEKVKNEDYALSLRANFKHVVRLRNVWLIGLGSLGVRACIGGMTGYLPTYLKNVGWTGTDADSSLAIFYLASILFVIPLSNLSDRMGMRRIFMIAASAMMGLGTGLLFFGADASVIIAVLIAGFTFDGFMSISNTSVQEVEGVGVMHIGTALGFAHMIRNFGGTVAPPIGNSLAVHGANVPFLFWAGLAFLGSVVFMLLPDKSPKRVETVETVEFA